MDVLEQRGTTDAWEEEAMSAKERAPLSEFTTMAIYPLAGSSLCVGKHDGLLVCIDVPSLKKTDANREEECIQWRGEVRDSSLTHGVLQNHIYVCVENE